MKIILLLIILIFTISKPLSFMGKCGMAPKYRPLECYQNSVLPEDLDELSDILSLFQNGGDDDEFADLIGDMFDKKRFRENNNLDNEENEIGSCGMAPKYLPVECYEQNILRRDRCLIREYYDKYHESDLNKFNELYEELIEKKLKYYEPKY